eukprot:gb/GEZN01002477.1/.p1 GENE.gb/GEZN01002477.1/~~gb/GEZN01002477.1/.p1  ORF type:complete len:364 (-),score=19.22 gb/GEZN01002477.1/:1313-2404(-)
MSQDSIRQMRVDTARPQDPINSQSDRKLSDVNFDSSTFIAGTRSPNSEQHSPILGKKTVTEHTLQIPAQYSRPQSKASFEAPGFERKQTSMQRAASGILQRATTGLDKSNLLPRTEHEHDTYCSFRGCLICMWVLFLVVTIILLSISLTNAHEVEKVKKGVFQTSAAAEYDPYCPVLTTFNKDCPSCLNNVYTTGNADGPVRCGHWMLGTSPQTCGSGPCPDYYKGVMCGPSTGPYPCCMDSSMRSKWPGICTAKAAVDNKPPMAGPVCGFPNDPSSRSNTCPMPDGSKVDCRDPKYNPGVVAGTSSAMCCPQTVVDTTSDVWQQYTCYNGAATGAAAQWCVPLGGNGWCTVCVGQNCGGNIG